MARAYRAVLVEHPGSPPSLFIANDDGEAIEQVHRILGRQVSFDLHEGDRLVIKHRPAKPGSPTDLLR